MKKELLQDLTFRYQQTREILLRRINSGNRDDRNLQEIYLLQLKLSDLGDCSSSLPDFFTPERVEEVCSLIKQAGEYLGEKYGYKTVDRIEGFRKVVSSGLEAAVSLKKIGVFS